MDESRGMKYISSSLTWNKIEVGIYNVWRIFIMAKLEGLCLAVLKEKHADCHFAFSEENKNIVSIK